jgi:hypothetical protein
LAATNPAVTVPGYDQNSESAAGRTVRVEDRETPPQVAVISTAVSTDTAVVTTENCAFVCPLATVTETGTNATVGLELVIVTITPATGAAVFRTTSLSIFVTPPKTTAGDRATFDSVIDPACTIVTV